MCATVLGEMDRELQQIVDSDTSATARLRTFIRVGMERSHALFLNERRLQELVVVAIEEGWCTASGHEKALRDMIRSIVEAGRNAGEFERKTPIDEVSHAIHEALLPFTHAYFLQHRSKEELESAVVSVGNLILRSLSP